MKVSFQSQNCCFMVELNDSSTAKEIAKRLPFEAKVSRWGDEIYFGIPTGIVLSQDKTTLDVNIGDVAFWPGGNCLCVFFGPTPFSKENKPVPATSVIVIGKTTVETSEIDRICTDHSISLALVQEDFSSQDTRYNERKLSQAEIDILVQRLLSQKESFDVLP